MAAGTPVIAMNRGSAVEIIAHGQTGFLCQSVEECLAALQQVPKLDCEMCRQCVVQNFNVQRIVDSYEAVYRQLLTEQFVSNGHIQPAMF